MRPDYDSDWKGAVILKNKKWVKPVISIAVFAAIIAGIWLGVQSLLGGRGVAASKDDILAVVKSVLPYLIVMAVAVVAIAAAFIVYLWAEIMARVLKAPSNTYLIPGIIPLLPGGPLYYTMSAIVEGNHELFAENGLKTVFITFGMAAGMAAVIVHYLLKIKKVKSKRKATE